jgi:hypothetical protein
MGDIMAQVIYIHSKDRPDIINTHKLLGEDIEYYILLEDLKQKKLYIKNPTIDPNKIMITGAYGNSAQRQWVLEHTPVNEWMMMMDDNIREVRSFHPAIYDTEKFSDRDIKLLVGPHRKFGPFMVPLNPLQILQLAEECKTKADSIGSHLVAFSIINNPMYRRSKWATVSYIGNKMILVKRSKLNYSPEKYECLDEVDFLCKNLLTFGKVLVNRYVFPDKRHYERGGIGTYKQRLPRKIKECHDLVEEYPGLLAFKQRVGKPLDSEVGLTVRTEKQVEKYRKERGFL